MLHKENKLKLNGKISVFIDAANLELSAKDKGWKVDYKKLHKWLLSLGSIQYLGFFTVRFANKQHDNFLTLLKKSGYSLTTKPLKLIKVNKGKDHLRKANFDVEIAVEAMKRINNFNIFILFSGDSDFDFLLKELKTRNKKTIVISTRYHVAKELVDRADYYVDLRKIKNLIERKSKQ